MKHHTHEYGGIFSTDIGAGVTLRGHLRTDQPLVVRGRIEGSIHGTVIRIDRGAIVRADPLKADSIVVAGRVEGRLEATENILAMPGASMAADITAPAVRIQEGALFEGSITMR